MSNPYVLRLLNSKAAPLAMELFLPHKAAYKEITESMSVLHAGDEVRWVAAGLTYANGEFAPFPKCGE